MTPADRAPIGRTRWAVPGGHVPLESTGPEPALTSRDTLALLNAADADAAVEITLHYEDGAPVGPYRVTVGARRLRRVRVNDLIDPVAPPLDTPYAAVVTSDVPIVVRFGRLDSGPPPRAILGAMALPADA